MDNRAREIVAQGNALFSQRTPIVSLWQGMAEQFYPERADFTIVRSIGNEFAGQLVTGAPVMARRDLANSFSSMLRPRGAEWFHARTGNETINNDAAARAWLDHATSLQRRVMYDDRAKLVRATKEGDNDFAAFGQCVISVDFNQNLDGLLYRCWHLRDVAWKESVNLDICHVHRKWKIPVREYLRLFPKTASPKAQEALAKNPDTLVECRHVMMPKDEYDLTIGKSKFAYVSLYVDVDNEIVLEEKPAKRVNYVIPRWQTVPGSQYAYSPATVVAISDARMLQQMTLTLLEAGQKSVDPPMLAVQEAIQGGVNLYAGGVTWVDAAYDERLGEVLRPLSIDRSGFQWGNDREQKIREMISEAFYLNQIQLPDVSGEMTAYETQKRVEEYIRRALPLFEPLEQEYNGALCNITFEMLMDVNGFGPWQWMPPSLQGQDIRFQFDSPLQASVERIKAQAFLQSAQMLQVAAAMDPNARFVLDIPKAFRGALQGAQAPSEWIVPEDEAAAHAKAAAQAQALQAGASMVGQGADLAQRVATATQALQGAGLSG